MPRRSGRVRASRKERIMKLHEHFCRCIHAAALVLTILATTTALASPQKNSPRPALSMDFAQYCVGDPWEMKLTNSELNKSISLLGQSNGQSWELTDWGKTDGDGNFTEGGKHAEVSVGSHTLKIDIGGTVSNTVSFVVSDCRPNGRIVFVSDRDGVPYIYVANADGSGVTRLTRGERPAWSGDGKKIAFNYLPDGGRWEIRVINADGSNERTILSGMGTNPSWSPDDTKIAFRNGGIFVMSADGSAVTRVIINDFGFPQSPSWSPDGRSIAYVLADWDVPWSVRTLDLKETDASSRLILDRVGGASRPAWSPDGTRLLLEAQYWEIASVSRDGSDYQSHVVGTWVGEPDWSPDGKSIVFSKFTGPGDVRYSLGSRKRIFVASIEDGLVRQVIPEAVNPALPDYWDSVAAWSRVRQFTVDRSEYCVGETWKARLVNGPPDTKITLSGISNGASWYMPWGTTDKDGSFAAEGIYREGSQGNHSLSIMVGEFESNVVSNTVFVSVSVCGGDWDY